MATPTNRLLALLIAGTLVACTPAAPPAVTDVRIRDGDRTLEEGTITLLVADVTAQGGAATTVTWSSADDSVVHVQGNGIAMAVSEGTTTVTATSTVDATQSDTVTIHVIPDPEAPYTVEGTMLRPDGSPPPLGVAVILLDDFTASEVLRNSVTEVGDGFYVGPVAAIDGDGRFTIAFPDGSGLPDGVFSPADDFVLNARGIDECHLTASNPDARVTFAIFEIVTVPGLGVLTTEGLSFGITSDTPLDVDLDTAELADFAGFAYQTWVFADRAVSVETMGAGCSTEGDTFLVDVTLVEGWNQLAWTITVDSETDSLTGIALNDAAISEVFAVGAYGF